MRGFRRLSAPPSGNGPASTGPRLAGTLVALAAAAALIAAPAGAASATSRSPTATRAKRNGAVSGAAARRAQAAATQARAQVDAQLQHYQDASARVDAGITALTSAFADASGAEVTQDEATAQVRRARARQGEQVRALYAAGGPIGLTATILTATSPQDALWRASTADRALATVFADTSSQVQDRADQVALTRRRSAAADAATQAQAQALNALQQRSAVAAQALAQARQTLAALDTRARNARAALASAREIAAAQVAAAAARRTAMGSVTALGIPATFETDYRDAARTCPGMSWTLLAAVGQVESGHGRNDGPSSAGAIGPMQFEPGTFAAYAVDGDRDGVLNAWDPADAIFTAAHYLCVSGATGGGAAGIHAALLTYNHAEWYVDLVLAAEQAIITRQATLDAP